jgi:hypothetical protein
MTSAWPSAVPARATSAAVLAMVALRLRLQPPPRRLRHRLPGPGHSSERLLRDLSGAAGFRRGHRQAVLLPGASRYRRLGPRRPCDRPRRPDDRRLRGDAATRQGAGPAVRDAPRRRQPAGGRAVVGRYPGRKHGLVGGQLLAVLPGAGQAPVGLPGQQQENPRIQHTVLLVHGDGRIPQRPPLTGRLKLSRTPHPPRQRPGKETSPAALDRTPLPRMPSQLVRRGDRHIFTSSGSQGHRIVGFGQARRSSRRCAA